MNAYVFHLTTEADFRRDTEGGIYRPPSLEREGFVHCSGDPAVTLEVAGSYFRQAPPPVWVLQLRVDALGAEVRWEGPAPLAAGAQGHHRPGRLFPHVYGPIPLAAVEGAGALRMEGESFAWPEALVPLEALGVG